MTIKKDSLANQVRNAYDRLEPGEADTWNPLFSEFEIAYRLSLFYWLTQALLLSPLSLESLNVLDLGCGNGRSTRMYVDLGLRPEQLMGVDVRVGTIDLARKLNPAIRFETFEGDPTVFANQGFNWLSIAGVLSSIESMETRQQLAQQIYQTLPPGGFLFYFDLYQSLNLVGGERVRPLEVFSNFKKVWSSPVRSYQFVPSGFKGRDFVEARQKGVIKQEYRLSVLNRLKRTILPTHEVVLFQR